MSHHPYRAGMFVLLFSMVLALPTSVVAGGPVPTLIAGIDCTPDRVFPPDTTTITVSLANIYLGQTRRMAAHVDVTLASGEFISNWRAGYTNIAAGVTHVTSWPQDIPYLASLDGENTFTVVAEDVTPAPYNLPPYPAAGDTSSDLCTLLVFLK